MVFELIQPSQRRYNNDKALFQTLVSKRRIYKKVIFIPLQTLKLASTVKKHWWKYPKHFWIQLKGSYPTMHHV